MKRILCFVLCLTLVSASLLENVVYGASEQNNKGTPAVASAEGNVLTVPGILRQFEVSEDWLDEQLSKGYTLYQIYTALQGGKEGYETAVSRFNVSRAIEEADLLVLEAESSPSESYSALADDFSATVQSLEYDQAAVEHYSLQDDSSLYEIGYGTNSIATATGEMKLRYMDFSLPGALSFPLIRVYDSARANDEIGVKLENDSYINESRIRREELDTAIGRGWRWEIPYIDTYGGSRILDFPGTGRYKLSEDLQLEGYLWNDLKFTTDRTQTVGNSTSEIKLSVRNGNQFYFNSSGHLILTADNYGNKVYFHYAAQGEGTILSRIVNSDGNELIFTYSEDRVTVTQSGTNRKMEYFQEEEYGQKVLSEVKDAAGRSTKYFYFYPESRFNFLSSLTNQEALQPVKSSALLLRIVRPGSGVTDFDYLPARKQIGDYATDFVFKVSSRQDSYSTTAGDEVLHPVTFSYSGEDLNSYGDSATWTTTMEASRSKDTRVFSKVFQSSSKPDIHFLDEQRSEDGSTQHKQQFTYDESKGWNAPIQIAASYAQGGSTSEPFSVNYQYNDEGLVTAENWSTGQEISYEYAASAAPFYWALPSKISTKLSSNQSRVEQYQYNNQGSVLQSSVRENSASGKLLAQTELVYDPYGNITSSNVKDDKRTNTVNYTYQSPYGKHLPTKRSMVVHSVDGFPTEVNQQYEYTSAGELKSAEDESGALTTFTYDVLGRPIQTLYSDQTTKTVRYDDELNTVTTTGTEGIVIVEKFSPLGLLVQEKVDDALFQYAYDQEGNMKESVDAERNKTSYVYDGFNRLTGTIFADGSQDRIEYDMVGRTTTYTDPAGVKHQEKKDLLGNVLSFEESRNGVYVPLEQTAYDLEGNPVIVTDGNGGQSRFEYDALGRMVSVTDPGQRSTRYTYSLAGYLTKIQYPDNTYVEKEYNQAGNLIRQINEERLVKAFFYDSRGNLIKSLDHASQFTEYEYNSDNLLTLIKAPGQQIKYSYDAMGRRTGMTDATGNTTYNYDPQTGLLTKIAYPDGTQIEYSYNKQMRAGYTLKDASGNTTGAQYTLDAMNRVSALDVAHDASSNGRMAAFAAGSGSPVDRMTFDYQANGLLQIQSSSNGLSTSYTYEGYDLTAMTLAPGAAGRTLRSSSAALMSEMSENAEVRRAAGQQFTYQYDDNKNIISRSQDGAADTFAYDSLNRIQEENGQDISKKYVYDERGNRLEVEGQQVRGMTNAEFTFDSLNRLTKVTGEDGTEVSYSYNGDGLLYERAEGTERTRYYYDEQAKLIAEANVSNGTPNLTYTYIYDLAGRLWSRVAQATGEVQYYQFNGHGDVVGLVDRAGNQLNSYTYDIWGNPEHEEETVPNIFRYSGEYWDEATDLQYLRARWYDPNAGRFVSKDSYEGDITNPLSQNLYTYVHNNPLIYTDPSGMCVAGKDAGCYVDSFSGLDGLIDNPLLANNKMMWDDIQKYIVKYCKNTSCVTKQKNNQRILEKANDEIRNNVCSYIDCSIGEASFILKDNEAIGIRIKVEIIEPKPSFWDNVDDFLFPTAYATELPPKEVGRNNFGYIEHYYRSGDHAPPHVHVVDNKKNVVRVGQNGKPLDGEPELNRAQQMLVTQYKKEIRSSVSQIMKWHKYSNSKKYGR
ncbi:RHS repeat-associated core domain-containing protein [Paenibacillus bouchesdurhonensis]|uniref:RHS repeat-associated core domain-containing protein n=1 Tax=Paenibacillus bouchesdurhonensis TaxID=1870990 RepID=UPI000DA61DB8|nr:RHS repeat-associated core domain-containing protein [Paenibacillus bouchesdurhonensis]